MLRFHHAEPEYESATSGLIFDLLSEALTLLESDQQRSAQNTLRHAVVLIERGKTDDDEGLIKGGLCSWQAERLDRYIESSLDSELSLMAAAQVAGLSVSHFSRAFRISFGVTFPRCVTQRRVDRACRLMLTTETALCDIALRCGFADQAHFCRQFRASMNETPSAWRRRMRLAD